MSKRFVFLLAAFFLGLLPVQAKPQLLSNQMPACKVIVIGFVGGMRSPDDVKQGVVQIGHRLDNLSQPDLKVNIYRHWFWRRAYDWLYQTLDLNHDKQLSKEELALMPRIVIYGHSLGGWAVNKLSRKLAHAG